MFVIFRNAGEIDPVSISTFGASSKTHANPVGFFGTGLKYAIAILLREGCSIVIFSGRNRFDFATKRTRIRNDDFDVVTMNGEPLGFTTELGKTWKMWQALRELVCNTRDEKGTAADSHLFPAPEEGVTQVVVHGQSFFDAWSKRSQVFLDQEPVFKHESAHLHLGPSDAMFYRGVKVAELDKPSLLKYDIQAHLQLTEDRTTKYPWEPGYSIRTALLACEVPELIEQVLTAPKEFMEHDMELSGSLPSTVFLDVVEKLWNSREIHLNPKAVAILRTFRLGSMVRREGLTLDEQDLARLNRAVSFCEALGYPVRNYPIVVSDFLGDGVLGAAEDGQIILARRVFMMGTKMLAGTILEEYIHLAFKHADGSRELQNFLVDAVISLGERLTKEVL